MRIIADADPIGSLARLLTFRLEEMAATIGPRPAGIALSGGADSGALARAARRLDPHFPLAIVDHGLRPDSAAEAARVAQCFSPPADILPVGGEAHSPRRLAADTGLEERARRFRYDRLAEWARMRGLSLVLTGHHADDAVETLAMRLRRRPGLLGLAGLRALAPFPNWPEGAGLFLGRPFLALRRTQLRAILRAAGHEWVEDPMNTDPVFERACLRALWAAADEAADQRRFHRMFTLYEKLCARRARAASVARAALGEVVFDATGESARMTGALFSGLPPSAQGLLAQAVVAAVADRPLLPAAGAARQLFLAVLGGAPVRSFHLTLVSARANVLRVTLAPLRRGAMARPSGGRIYAAGLRAMDLLVS